MEANNTKKSNTGSGTWFVFVFLLLGLIGSFFFWGKRSQDGPSGSWVNAYVTRSGKIVPGHYRKSQSTDPNAIRNRSRSHYYYESRGKYLRKK